LITWEWRLRIAKVEGAILTREIIIIIEDDVQTPKAIADLEH
jgi:hypothetical protein